MGTAQLTIPSEGTKVMLLYDSFAPNQPARAEIVSVEEFTKLSA
jgi:hypothetical protein